MNLPDFLVAWWYRRKGWRKYRARSVVGEGYIDKEGWASSAAEVSRIIGGWNVDIETPAGELLRYRNGKEVL